MNPQNSHLIWLDLEMTGLNPDRDRVLEIATVITDSHLNIIAAGPVMAIHQPDELLEGMDEWNTRQHTKTGLLERVKASNINEEDAQAATLEFVMRYVPPNKSPMCGNSICQDRRFLYRWLPKLEQYFHYRNLDVSTVKILAQRWSPQVATGLKKESQHIALQDIYDSIEELRYYREKLFK
jgi:oligoribonuclease